MISKKLFIISVSVLVIIILGISSFYINKKMASPDQQIVPSSTYTSSTTPIEYIEGQHIDGVWKVRERVQDCGGGESCLDYLVIELSEDVRTENIWAIRINMGNCVDEAIQAGDIVRVSGSIEKIVPDIGLILSCHSSETSVIKN